ncbi:MAG: hypothetical protein ABIE03_01575 [Patescibacteria group bacterium]|nr:hypothetical protein [Patescibacteria group bacterium]
MNKKELYKIIRYIVSCARGAIQKNTDFNNLPLDYLAIFSKNEKEFRALEKLVRSLGEEVEKNTHSTGYTYLLDQPIDTEAGELKLLKVRKPDQTRPQRGAPDFRVPRYPAFKDKYLYSSGNFTLMIRKDFEMIELKGNDVLVYFPDKPVGLKYD